jgi:hypothetical protein
MNFIIYLLDGLSPLSIRSNSNKKFFGFDLKNNYISNLQKKSLNFTNLYGYGETYSTTYEYFTKKNIYDNFCDSPNILKSFSSNTNLAYYFKQKKFNTFLFRDPCQDHPMSGFYKRYFNSIKQNFDYYCIKKKKKNYSFKNFFYENQIINFLKKSENNFFFIHDFSLHDNKKAYINASPKSYLEAVNISSDIIRLNLNLIKYSETKDTLIFLSDHGLNVSPYDQLHFKKKISLEIYDKYYSNLFIDEKLKATCFIKHPEINKDDINIFYKPNLIFYIVRGLLKLKKNKIKSFILKLKKKINNNIIVSIKAAQQDPYNNYFLKNYFHCHLIFLSQTEKVAYSHNHKNQYYDLINKKFIPASRVNYKLLSFKRNYLNYKNYAIKFFLSLLSMTYRIFLKIFIFFK